MDDHDHDRDRDHANDNGEHERPGSKLAPAPAAGGALTSLTALQTVLNASIQRPSPVVQACR